MERKYIKTRRRKKYSENTGRKFSRFLMRKMKFLIKI